MGRRVALALAAASLMACQSAKAPLETVGLGEARLEASGVVVPVKGGLLKLEVRRDDIVRVAFATDAAFFTHQSFAVLPASGPAATFHWDAASGTLSTGRLQVRVDAAGGKVAFFDAAGRPLLQEARRSVEPAEVMGEKTFHVRQEWASRKDESLYGLGQHQFGLVDIKGYDFDLWQHNTEIAVPFLASSRGYGILWDNPSWTKFGDPRPFVAIPADHLVDAQGNAGGLTVTTFADSSLRRATSQRREPAVAVVPAEMGQAAGGQEGNRRGEQGLRWEGQLRADAAGDYQFQLYANGGYRMWIDDQLVIEHWRQNWLPWNDLARAHFAAGSMHKLKIEWSKDQGTHCVLSWKTPPASDDTSLWSQVGEGVDYYFVYGPDLDRVLAGYRQLTGQAPMMPVWAFGLWQSRQRYNTQNESLEVVRGFRERGIPFDTIVQDWYYWPENAWGAHRFDPVRFPDPDAWIETLHALHARLMISVWGKFYPGTDHFDAMQARGYLYQPTLAEHIRDWVGRGYEYAFYDAFNPAARKLFWQQVHDRLFVRHIDAWWMDATEPDLMPSPPTLDRQFAHMPQTAAGPGARVLNAYPLLNSQGIYEGQRQAAPDQRVFVLTRSGYAGQQRYAAAVWSGDISSSWTAMHKQIAAGLGASISGLPYWTMDAGGFAVPGKFNARNAPPDVQEEWRELNTRWFEFAAFVPLLRVHGEAPAREMWRFGGDSSPAYQAQLKFDRLRYRLLPYLYSLAGDVTHHGTTFMRPLVMDFPDDPLARTLNDQYLFGPAILVSPVTAYQVRSRSVYLPETPGGWYDFWTGQSLPGGRRADAPAPYDAIPLHIRAGSILPLGPDLQYTTEKKPDPLTLLVYTGADGRFSLYEDDGLTYAYEHGAWSRIDFTWNQQTRTLAIAPRRGRFPGMLEQRRFRICFITPDKPVPFAFDPPVDRTVQYDGRPIDVHAP